MFEDFLLSLQKNYISMSKEHKKISYTEIKTIMDYTTGEVFNKEITKTVVVDKEPDFAKMYFTDLIRIAQLEKSSLLVLLVLCKEMGYNNIIAINKSKKERVSKELKISTRTFEGCVLKLYKAGFLIKIAHGEYLVDPSLFARGNWKEIKNLQLTITYNPDGTRSIRSNIMEEMIKQGLRE